MFADKPVQKPIEPSEAALDALIAEQMANLPAWWDKCEEYQGRVETRRNYRTSRSKVGIMRRDRKWRGKK